MSVSTVKCAVTNHSAMHKCAWNVESGISKFILDGEGARFALQYSKLLCISSIPNKGKEGFVCNHIRDVFASDIIKMSVDFSGQFLTFGRWKWEEKVWKDEWAALWLMFWLLGWKGKESSISSVSNVVSEEAFIRRNLVFYLNMHTMLTILKCICLQVK